LTTAELELYRPRWSVTILDETRRTLINRIGMREDQVDYTLTQMQGAFPEALVTGYEAIASSMPVNEKDRHVMAAALVGRAELIVTNNLRDFPEDLLAPLGLKACDADSFLMDLLARHRDRVHEALQFMADNTGKAGKPELSLYDIVKNIAATAENFAAAALYLFDIT